MSASDDRIAALRADVYETTRDAISAKHNAEDAAKEARKKRAEAEAAGSPLAAVAASEVGS